MRRQFHRIARHCHTSFSARSGAELPRELPEMCHALHVQMRWHSGRDGDDDGDKCVEGRMTEPPSSSAALPVQRQQRSSLPPPHIATLHEIMQRDSVVLNMHRELTLALATGDAESAGECAAALAARVRRHLQQRAEHHPPQQQGSPAAAAAEAVDRNELPPAPSASLLELAVDKAVEGALGEERRLAAAAAPAAAQQQGGAGSLEATIIDTSFEADVEPAGAPVASGGATGAVESVSSSSSRLDDDAAAEAAAAEARAEEVALQVLDEYLANEETRWRLQRHAVAKVVIEAAQAVGITAAHVGAANAAMADELRVRQRRLDLMGGPPLPSSGGGGGAGEQVPPHITPFQLCNVVVRGNAPVGAAASRRASPRRRAELEEQVARMRELALQSARAAGEPAEAAWSERIEQIVRFELQLQDATMSYDVGLHDTLSTAIDLLAGDAAATNDQDAAAAQKRKRQQKARRLAASSVGASSVGVSGARRKGSAPAVQPPEEDEEKGASEGGAAAVPLSRRFVEEVIRRLNEPSHRVHSARVRQRRRESADSSSSGGGAVKESTSSPSRASSRGGEALSSVDEALALPVLPFSFLVRIALRVSGGGEGHLFEGLTAKE